MFRELIINLLGGAGKKPEDEYCSYCKAAKLDADCDTCDKKIKMMNPAGSSKSAVADF